jgi:hypothetical protein
MITGRASIEISQQPDVVGFVSEQIGRGCAIGAIYSRFPAASDAIDHLALALARRVLEQRPTHSEIAPRDKWLQAANALVALNQPPLPSGYSAETNVDRLIRWVEHRCERVLIGVLPLLDAAGVRDAVSVAEWMNRVSRLPTLVVHGANVPTPIIKRGAPRSSQERSLAARLQCDPELRDLFEPNVLLLTIFETSPRVDFVWRAGRLIVEIDSHHFHSKPESFADDRQRDYETGVSGYMTLRLTDQEVSHDLDLVVQKIRRCVRLRKNLFHV